MAPFDELLAHKAVDIVAINTLPPISYFKYRLATSIEKRMAFCP
jgi:hypothetical protein